MFKTTLQQLAQQHLLRELMTIDSPAGPTVTVQDRSVLQFASNNYLGLATHPAVKQAAIDTIQRYGVGSGASRLISGSLLPQQRLEERLADLKGTESALGFSSGYLTNIGVIPALATTDSLILADRLCHASLVEGCRLSKATLRIFRHNDPEHLKTLLSGRKARRPVLIITEGVFSMDGDLAPLPDIVELARTYEATLLVDDAHGTGVMGAHGRGTVEHFGIPPHALLHMGTLSKAIGVSGGFVAGPKDFTSYLVNTSRPFIFSTAPSPALAGAALTALDILAVEPDRRTRLWGNRARLLDGLSSMGYTLTPTQSPILPVLLKDPELAVRMSRALLEEGIFIPAIRPPTVPRHTSRLRITVTADHTPSHIDTCLSALHRVGKALRII